MTDRYIPRHHLFAYPFICAAAGLLAGPAVAVGYVLFAIAMGWGP